MLHEPLATLMQPVPLQSKAPPLSQHVMANAAADLAARSWLGAVQKHDAAVRTNNGASGAGAASKSGLAVGASAGLRGAGVRPASAGQLVSSARQRAPQLFSSDGVQCQQDVAGHPACSQQQSPSRPAVTQCRGQHTQYRSVRACRELHRTGSHCTERLASCVSDSSCRDAGGA
jgi:hypothetical protein